MSSAIVRGGVVSPWMRSSSTLAAGDEAGRITARAASETGLPEGIPVTVGTIDAWAEGLSVGATKPGDLMLMYGTTMFLVGNTTQRVRHPHMWGTTGLVAGQYNLAGGMATSGAITTWLRDLTGADYATLSARPRRPPPGPTACSCCRTSPASGRRSSTREPAV